MWLESNTGRPRGRDGISAYPDYNIDQSLKYLEIRVNRLRLQNTSGDLSESSLSTEGATLIAREIKEFLMVTEIVPGQLNPQNLVRVLSLIPHRLVASPTAASLDNLAFLLGHWTDQRWTQLYPMQVPLNVALAARTLSVTKPVFFHTSKRAKDRLHALLDATFPDQSERGNTIRNTLMNYKVGGRPALTLTPSDLVGNGSVLPSDQTVDPSAPPLTPRSGMGF